MISKTNLEIACLLHAAEDLVVHHASPTVYAIHGGSVPHHRQVHPITWDTNTSAELVMKSDSIPDLLVRPLVAMTIQPSTQTSIGFESREDRTRPVIRHHGHVHTSTATEASCQFSTLLDSVEAGDIVVITRGNRPIAEIRPVARRTGQDLRTALKGILPSDGKFIADVVGAVNFATHARTSPRENA